MYDAMAMSIADSVGNLAREAQPDVKSEGRAALAQKVIQPDLIGIASE